jgi:hypothetical protein
MMIIFQQNTCSTIYNETKEHLDSIINTLFSYQGFGLQLTARIDISQ